MAKITIFGLAGTGTSSTGKELAKRLAYDFISTGGLMRKKAAELNLSIYEFDALCAKNPVHDEHVDFEIKRIGETSDNFVIESRLAWHFIPQSFKIKLICDFDERVHRVARRDGTTVEDAKENTIGREEIFVARNMKKYGIDAFAPDELFDLIIDTTHVPFRDVLDTIMSNLETKLSLVSSSELPK